MILRKLSVWDSIKDYNSFASNVYKNAYSEIWTHAELLPVDLESIALDHSAMYAF